ncbi:MAG TPA: glycosyltransferase family 1 protein [Patescibacteria group bacterium]|nr:glycosyltransferase family 1 protein [Patescibacteria group bacterium]
MIVGVDVGCLGIQDMRLQVGVYVMAKNLLQTLGKIDTKNTYFLYSFYPIEENLMNTLGKNMKNVVVKPVRGWMKLWLPLQLMKDNIDVFIGLNQSLPLQIPIVTHYKKIIVFHDIAFERYPAMYSYTGVLRKFHNQSLHAAKKADCIIAVSQKTKDDIISIYGIKEGKIVVAHEGIPVRSTGNKKHFFFPENPYFLYVGAIKKSKNIPGIIRGFSYFTQYTKMKYDLLFVGGKQWYDEDIRSTLQEISIEEKNRIQFLDFVEDTTLVSLYTHAVCFVSPSYYEGFGLPFVEAMHYGCPVIGSTRGSLPEIIGDSGILVDAENEKAIGKAMVSVVRDKKLREQLTTRGREREALFSWKTFAKVFLEQIES